MQTSTALQLKADTSPKPSTPCYYCDISNLSLPMTGLMIMFPVFFQPQITANSVIRGLLCQPSSGPLTVCRPGAVFSQCLDLWALLRHQQLTEVYRALPLPVKALVTEAMVPCRIGLDSGLLSHTFFCYNCHSVRSSQNR